MKKTEILEACKKIQAESSTGSYDYMVASTIVKCWDKAKDLCIGLYEEYFKNECKSLIEYAKKVGCPLGEQIKDECCIIYSYCK